MVITLLSLKQIRHEIALYFYLIYGYSKNDRFCLTAPKWNFVEKGFEQKNCPLKINKIFL